MIRLPHCMKCHLHLPTSGLEVFADPPSQSTYLARPSLHGLADCPDTLEAGRISNLAQV